MSRRLAAGLAVLAAIASPAWAGPAAKAESVVNDIRSRIEIDGRQRGGTLQERTAHHRVPGLSMAVIDDGRVVWSAGYGVLAQGAPAPVSPETLFKVASVSKPVTGFLTVRLAEQGRLDLDGDINSYLRRWRLTDRSAAGAGIVSARQLLSHTAGVNVSAFPPYLRSEAVPTPLQMLQGAPVSREDAIRVERTPGEGFSYSGGGYLVLQQALEDLTGARFQDLAQSVVFEPLGMTSSTFVQDLPSPLAARAARGHRYGRPLAGGWALSPNMAAEGLWTTAEDRSHFLLALGDAYQGRRPDVLSQVAAREMLTTAKLRDGRSGPMGLGPNVSGEGAQLRFAQPGNGLGYRALFLLFPHSGDGVVLLSNSDGGEALNSEIADAVGRYYGWPGYPRPTLRKTTRVPAPGEIAQVAGVYTIAAGNGIDATRIEVRPDGERLRVQAGNEAWWTYLPDAEGGFFHVDINSCMFFERGSDGSVNLVFSHLGDTYAPAPRSR